MITRQIKIGAENYTRIFATDDQGPGGANHQYFVSTVKEPSHIVGVVSFQKGPVKEVGINGYMNEDLLAMVIDRLEGFQKGPYACEENDHAILNLKATLEWLNARTQKRVDAGIEGTSVV